MPKASRGAQCRQRDTIDIEHVDLVTLQQIIKCVRANLLDQAPLRIMDGDALEPVYRERWQLQSRKLSLTPEEGRYTCAKLDARFQFTTIRMT